MNNGAGVLHITIGYGNLRVRLRNNLVTYIKRKWGPPENLNIDNVGGVLVHLHWLLCLRGESNDLYACTRSVDRSIVGGRCSKYLCQVCIPGTDITGQPQEILHLIPDWGGDLDMLFPWFEIQLPGKASNILLNFPSSLCHSLMAYRLYLIISSIRDIIMYLCCVGKYINISTVSTNHPKRVFLVEH